jgi:hypothetical protein
MGEWRYSSNILDLLMFFLKPPYATLFLFSILLCANLLHVSAPISGHLQVKCTQNIYKGDHTIKSNTETLLRTVVLRKTLVDTRATGCKPQQLFFILLGGEWSALRSFCFTLGEISRASQYIGGWWATGRCEVKKNLLALPGIKPWLLARCPTELYKPSSQN